MSPSLPFRTAPHLHFLSARNVSHPLNTPRARKPSLPQLPHPNPAATSGKSLPFPPSIGYWRGDITRTFVRECLNPSACVGGRGIGSSSDSDSDSDSVITAAVTTTASPATLDSYDETRYCVEGHKGAYCAVCADRYRRISGGQLCVSCDGGWSGGARAAVWVLGAAAPVVLIVLVVFLVGGLAALSQVSVVFFFFFSSSLFCFADLFLVVAASASTAKLRPPSVSSVCARSPE